MAYICSIDEADTTPAPVPLVSALELQQVLAEHRQALRAMLSEWFSRELELLACSVPDQSITPQQGAEQPLHSMIGQATVSACSLCSKDVNKSNDEILRQSEEVEVPCHVLPSQDQRISEYDLRRPTKGSTHTKISGLMRTGSAEQEVSLEISANAQHLARQINENSTFHLVNRDTDGDLMEFAMGLNNQRGSSANTRCLGIYEILVSLIIFANTVSISAQVDLSARRFNEPEPPVFEVLECMFFSLYAADVLVKIALRRKLFFTGPNANFNRFDLFLVISSVPDRIFYFAGVDGRINISFLRLVRLSKLMRLGRMGRMLRRSLYIQLMFKLVFTGTKNILPLLSFVMLMIFLFSLAILTMVGGFLRDERETMELELKNHLANNWGSLKNVMLSCFMAVAGGAEWNELAWGLRETGTFCYVVFLVYVSTFMFIVTNVITCCFVQITILLIENADKFKVSVQMARQRQLVDIFQEIMGAGTLTYHEFHEQMQDNPNVEGYFSDVVGVSRSDADYLFFALSASGTELVDVQTFILGCIELKGPVTKMDLMKLKSNLDAALEEQSANQVVQKTNTFGSSLSTANKKELEVVSLKQKELKNNFAQIGNNLALKMQQTEFLRAAQHILSFCLHHARGGCGFVMTTSKGYASLKNKHVDFQVVDRDSRFHDGYMTQRLREIWVDSETFNDAMLEFTSHSDSDRWPSGHEADGLPKDGFTALTMSGKVLKSATRITGLPTPPYRWDGVGTRHLAGLAVCWALRLYPSLIVVRSDSGATHCLWAAGSQVMAVRVRVKKTIQLESHTDGDNP